MPFESRTGSSLGVQKKNGEIIATCHKVAKKSYNDAQPRLSGLSSTMKESFKDPNQKAALTPYHPHAIRNRLPVVFKDAAIPGVRFCYPRNVPSMCAAPPCFFLRISRVHSPSACASPRARCSRKPCAAALPRLHRPESTVTEPGFNRFRTTSQNYFGYDPNALSVGESNQGIVSEKSKIIHLKQQK